MKDVNRLARVGAMAKLLREAEAAHAEYEKTLGHRDEDWAEWYAGFMVQKLEEREKQTTNPE